MSPPLSVSRKSKPGLSVSVCLFAVGRYGKGEIQPRYACPDLRYKSRAVDDSLSVVQRTLLAFGWHQQIRGSGYGSGCTHRFLLLI